MNVKHLPSASLSAVLPRGTAAWPTPGPEADRSAGNDAQHDHDSAHDGHHATRPFFRANKLRPIEELCLVHHAEQRGSRAPSKTAAHGTSNSLGRTAALNTSFQSEAEITEWISRKSDAWLKARIASGKA
jgi:hypothetical protein